MKLAAKVGPVADSGDGWARLSLDVSPLLDGPEVLGLSEGDWVDVRLKPRKQAKSLKQNALLWATLHEMDKLLHGVPTEEGRVALYHWALEKAGAEYDDVAVSRRALDVFAAHLADYRMMRILHEEGDMVLCRCYPGVSQFDKKAMSRLLDVVLQEAEGLGIPRKVGEWTKETCVL